MSPGQKHMDTVIWKLFSFPSLFADQNIYSPLYFISSLTYFLQVFFRCKHRDNEWESECQRENERKTAGAFCKIEYDYERAYVWMLEKENFKTVYIGVWECV